jgi:hypothetical protein
MNKKMESKSCYALSEEQKRQLTSEQKMSEQKAWISAIYLPSSESDVAPVQGNEIAVEVLMSNGQTFWQVYKVSESYISEDSNFADLIRWTGNDLDTIESAVKSSVNVVFDEELNDWKIDPDIYSSNSSEDDVIKVERILNYFLYGLISIFLAFLILVLSIRTRGLFLVFVIIIAFGLYRIRNNLYPKT